jgi:hypothetical protein
MDDLRDSLSKQKKDIEHRPKESKREADTTGTDGRGERADSSASLPRPEPHVLTGGDREREGNEPNADDENVGPSTVPDEGTLDLKSTTSASAKTLLCG